MSTIRIQVSSHPTACLLGGCQWWLTSHFGSRYHCGIFQLRGEELRDEQGVLSGAGILQRLPECKAASLESDAMPLSGPSRVMIPFPPTEKEGTA